MKFILSTISILVLMLGTSSFAFAADASSKKPTQVAAAQSHTLVNINTADVQALSQLKGVGTKKAEAILAWRKANGHFKTIEQLMDVKGIGESILKANKGNITI